MDARGCFTVTPAGHLGLVEPYARGIRLIRNGPVAGPALPPVDAAFQREAARKELAALTGMYADLRKIFAAPSAQPAPGQAKPKPMRQSPAAGVEPSPEAKAKADKAFAKLMAEEEATARKQARKKAGRQREQDRDRAQDWHAKGGAGAVPPLPPATEAKAPAGPPSGWTEALAEEAAQAPAFQVVSPRGGARSGPGPGRVPRGGERWIAPCGPVDQRGIAARTAAFAAGRGFTVSFGGWASRQGPPPAGRDQPGTGKPERKAAPASPRTEPAGVGPFTLSRKALERTVQWMLAQAGQANPAAEYQVWRRSGALGHPRFSFGMYQQAGNGGRASLELRDLQAVARRIDAAAGGTLLSGELAASGGITGLQTRKDGSVWFTYGLTVSLGEGNQSLAAVRPGGDTSLEPQVRPRPTEVPAPAPLPAAPAMVRPAMPVPQSAPQAAPAAEAPPGPVPLPAPAPRPSRLNPNAPEFIMPAG
jgi:hypothetical protein